MNSNERDAIRDELRLMAGRKTMKNNENISSGGTYGGNIMSELHKLENVDAYFVRNQGWKYKTESALKAGYERYLKYCNNELLTQDEFVEESGLAAASAVNACKEVYDALAALVAEKKLDPFEIYNYARFRWLSSAASVVCYQTGKGWKVNNCGIKMSEDAAKIAVNGEWGFEASRVKIIGTPYYDAPDYQFIRFDCAHRAWLWQNGTLYQSFC